MTSWSSFSHCGQLAWSQSKTAGNGIPMADSACAVGLHHQVLSVVTYGFSCSSLLSLVCLQLTRFRRFSCSPVSPRRVGITRLNGRSLCISLTIHQCSHLDRQEVTSILLAEGPLEPSVQAYFRPTRTKLRAASLGAGQAGCGLPGAHQTLKLVVVLLARSWNRHAVSSLFLQALMTTVVFHGA